MEERYFNITLFYAHLQSTAYLHTTKGIDLYQLNIIFLLYYDGIIDNVIIFIGYYVQIFFIYYNDRDE